MSKCYYKRVLNIIKLKKTRKVLTIIHCNKFAIKEILYRRTSLMITMFTTNSISSFGERCFVLDNAIKVYHIKKYLIPQTVCVLQHIPKINYRLILK